MENKPTPEIVTFIEWAASEEGGWVFHYGLWKKDGFRSRTTSELYDYYRSNNSLTPLKEDK